MYKTRQALTQGKPWVKVTVDRACALLNIPSLEVYETNARNACALIRTRRRHYFIYDPELIGTLHAIDDRLAAAVILHEVGHHYNCHVNGNRMRSRTSILYADRMTGWLAHQMGYSGEACSRLYELPRFRKGNSRIPEGQARKVAFRGGWLEAANPIGQEPDQPGPESKKANVNNGETAVAGLGLAAGLLLLAALFKS